MGGREVERETPVEAKPSAGPYLCFRRPLCQRRDLYVFGCANEIYHVRCGVPRADGVTVPARMSPGLPHSPHSRLTVCCFSASYHFLHSPRGAGNSSWYTRSCSGVRLAYTCVHALRKSPAAPVRHAAFVSKSLSCPWSGSSSHGGRRSRSVRQRRPASSSAALRGAQVSLGSASRSCADVWLRHLRRGKE